MRNRLLAVVIPIGLLAAGFAFGPLAIETTRSSDAELNSAEKKKEDIEPVLRAYPTARDATEKVASRLQKQYSGTPNVRIVADAQSRQILVLAPPGIQREIAQRLLEHNPPEAADPTSSRVERRPTVRPAIPSSQPIASKEIRLLKTTSEQFEASLLNTLGNRLAPVASREPEQSAYRLGVPGRPALGISINRKSRVVTIEGAAGSVSAAARLVEALDNPELAADRRTRLVSLKAAQVADVQPALEALAMQQEQPSAKEETPAAAPKAAAGGGDLIGPVQVEMLEGLDVLILRGHPRDVEKVSQIIQQIEQLSAVTKPAIEVVRLAHVDGSDLAALVEEVYQEVFLSRQGFVSITPLVKPNALLVVGRPENVATVIDLVQRLDQPVPPAAQFQVFRLKSAPAETAQTTVETFLAGPGEEGQPAGLGPRGTVIADFRTNSLIVRACPRDLAEVAALLARIDAPANEACNEVRVFKLKNSLATDLAPVLQDAITGQMYGQRARQAPGAQAAVGQRQDYERKSVRLRFVTIDPRGRGVLNSGILTDAQVTADARTNSLVVTASAESMPLIAALITELDQLPSVEAQIKVFTLANGDATSMMSMLQGIFGTPTGTAAAADTPAVRTGTAEGESSLVGLRFAVDVRTNSIIASGSAGQLTVVEAILLRLDESDVRSRESAVYRLKNAPAIDVANAINQYLRSERQVQQMAPGLVSAFQQIEREVVVVPEPVSNSLIVSATPRFFDEIMTLVKQIDERPPMVMIQVLIASVSLNHTDEFGVELGLQDAILFDRSVVGTGTLAGTNVPGYLFNSTGPLGNGNTAAALQNSNLVGGQGISNLGVGRLNSELGFGGLVLSASSEAVSVLIRALKECRRVDVLSRPQIMTMDNQTAEILVGQDVPTITASQFTELGGQINSIDYREVGLILTVTPRISPDKLVVMEIDATNSDVGPEAEGIPVSVAQGQVIRSPRINITSARTVVSASNGQTVVLGGLITKTNNRVTRKVPGLGDVPVLGRLFRFDSTSEHKAELLIIMTPHIVYSDEDAERIKQIESARMDWCLSDVQAIHGADGLHSRSGTGSEMEGVVIYPDVNPTLDALPVLPSPQATAPAPSPGTPHAPALTPAPGPGPAPKSVPNAAPPSPSRPSSPPAPLPPLEEPAAGRRVPPADEASGVTPTAVHTQTPADAKHGESQAAAGTPAPRTIKPAPCQLRVTSPSKSTEAKIPSP